MFLFLKKLPIAFLALVLSCSIAGNVAQASNDVVNVYSYRQPFLIKPMFDVFTRQSGIKVNTVFAKKGLLERLQNEGSNSPADLIFTVDVGRLSGALEIGVTQAVDSKTLQNNIPAEFRDPNNHWFGLTTRARIIVTSTDRVAKGAITRYEDLAKPEFKGKICTRSAKHEYMVALVASVIAHSGEREARAWLSGMKSNLARKPQGNDRGQVKAIAQGECDIAIINSYYMGAMLADEEQSTWANAVNILFPNQDDRGTHLNISGMALTKAAPNKTNAIQLMEFLVSDIAQQMYAEQNHEYPVKPDVKPSGLVQSWGTFNHDTLPLSDIATYRSTASKMADEVAYDQ